MVMMNAMCSIRSACSAGLIVPATLLLLATPAGAQTPGSGVEYLHVDALGSVRVVTDATGAVISRHDYLPYGEEVPEASRAGIAGYTAEVLPASTQRFTGKERDVETGLDYFGARYYSGAIGRFTAADAPFADQNTTDPQSWNLYSYTRNNPLKYIDTDGRGIETAWDVFNVGLGLKSLRENVKAGNYGSAALDALGVGIDAVAAAAPFIPGGAGSILKVLRVGDRLDDAVDLAKSGEAAADGVRLADDALVVRGGANTSEAFAKGSGVTVHPDGMLGGVSVNSAPGQSVEQLSAGIPHNKVGVTTVGSVRDAGGDVIPSPTLGNPNHCTLCGVTPEKAAELMKVIPNPAKKLER